MRFIWCVVVGGVLGSAFALFGVTEESSPLWNGCVWSGFAILIAGATCKELDPKPTWGETCVLSLVTAAAVFLPHVARHLSGF